MRMSFQINYLMQKYTSHRKPNKHIPNTQVREPSKYLIPIKYALSDIFKSERVYYWNVE